jgi:hypothetical protein
MEAVGGLDGYYVVAECKRGPFNTAERAYQLWEEDMQGEVLYMEDGALFYLDGSPVRL